MHLLYFADFPFDHAQSWERSHRMKTNISWDGPQPGNWQASLRDGNGSWWWPKQLNNSWSCPETAAKAGTKLQTCRYRMWLLVRWKDATVENSPCQLHKWLAWQEGFLLVHYKAWRIYIPSYLSGHQRALVSWAAEDSPVTSSRVQIQSFAYSSYWVFANRIMKHLYKTRVILPGESKYCMLLGVIHRYCWRKCPLKSEGPERGNIVE